MVKKKFIKSWFCGSGCFQRKISNESPIAQSLIGKHLDDEVRVPLPNGAEMKVKITNIQSQ